MEEDPLGRNEARWMPPIALCVMEIATAGQTYCGQRVGWAQPVGGRGLAVFSLGLIVSVGSGSVSGSPGGNVAAAA